MKKIIRVILIGLVAFVALSAFVKSNVNGESFWYNAGHQVKQVFNKSKDVSKDAMSDLKDGFIEHERKDR